jgi:hypothetical protein
MGLGYDQIRVLESIIETSGGGDVNPAFLNWINSSCQWSASDELYWTIKFKNPERDAINDVSDGDLRFAYVDDFVGTTLNDPTKSPGCPSTKVAKFKFFGPENRTPWITYSCFAHVIDAARSYVRRYNTAKVQDLRVPVATRALCQLEHENAKQATKNKKD